MKERLLESFAILLAGLFSAERPRPWRLGDAPANSKDAPPGVNTTPPSEKRTEN